MAQDPQQASVADILREIEDAKAHLFAAVETLETRLGSAVPVDAGALDTPVLAESKSQDKLESSPLAPVASAVASTASPATKSGSNSRIILT